MFVLSAFYQLIRSLLVPRLVLVTENLALRQQLLVVHRATNRPRLRHRDRLFWVALSHLWRDWRSILVIVKPRQLLSGTGRALSATGAGNPDLVASGVRRLTRRFAILLGECPAKIPSGERRGFKQNFTCLGTR
jgi:hypothetical protein